MLVAFLLSFAVLSSEGDSSAAHWRSGPFCGVNAIYTFLQLHNVDVSYEDVETCVPVTEEGSSLKHMKDCARRFGLETIIVTASPEELQSFEKPLIAHLEKHDAAAFSPASRGHFVVVISATSSRVRFIDGTTGSLTAMDASIFLRRWSGYLLVRGHSESSVRFFALFGLLALITAVVWIKVPRTFLRLCTRNETSGG